MKETFYILVISMWGNTGVQWEYIGSQLAPTQPMTEEQCLYLIDDAMWQASYENEYYQLRAHCVDANGAGKEKC